MRMVLCTQYGQRIQVIDYVFYCNGWAQKRIQFLHPDTSTICFFSGIRDVFPFTNEDNAIKLAGMLPTRYTIPSGLVELFGPLS